MNLRSRRRQKSRPASAPMWLLNRNFRQMELISKGGFSRVFRATRFGQVPRIVAVKVMKVKPTGRKSLSNINLPRQFGLLSRSKKEELPDDSEYDKPMPLDEIKRELQIWRELSEAKIPYIIVLYDQLEFGNEYWAIMELGEVSILDFIAQLRAE